jgi:SAM-dependent methyltransferase
MRFVMRYPEGMTLLVYARSMPMIPGAGDTFSNAAAYEGYVGRWSRLVAPEFIAWLKVPPGNAWLDVGAGTGILTQAILQQANPTKVVAVDLAPEFIDFARQQIHDDRVEFQVGDALAIEAETPNYHAAVAGLLLNFLPSPAGATQKMVQSVRNGGIVGAYVWDYGGQMEMMRHFWDAADQVDEAARSMDAGRRFTICEPDNLRALYQNAGLNAVDVIAIDVPTRFKSFDDFWLPFLGAQGSVSKYLRGLSAETLNAIRDQLQRQLPVANDGGIALNARAWAVKGTK